MDAYFNNFGGFGPASRRRHPFGPGPFAPHHHGGHGFPAFGPFENDSFGPFGPHGRRGGFGPRGRGGFGPGGFHPWGPNRWGPKPQESSSSSSSEDEEPKKKLEEETSSSSSDSEVDCHRRERKHGRRGKHHGRKHCHGHGDHHGRHGRHPFWPPHHHRHGNWPPHHHHWDPRAQEEEELQVEEVSQFGSDFQVIPDDVAAQMNDLQLQEDGPQDQSTKKWFRVALNAEGFKVKDIRIRLHQNKLLVEGKQDVKNALGSFKRSFAYSITVPTGVNTKKIKTKLGPDGILRIKAKKNREETDNEEVQVITVEE